MGSSPIFSLVLKRLEPNQYKVPAVFIISLPVTSVIYHIIKSLNYFSQIHFHILDSEYLFFPFFLVSLFSVYTADRYKYEIPSSAAAYICFFRKISVHGFLWTDISDSLHNVSKYS